MENINLAAKHRKEKFFAITQKISLKTLLPYTSVCFLFLALSTTIYIYLFPSDTMVKNGILEPQYPLATYSDSETQKLTRLVLLPNREYHVYAQKMIWYNGKEIIKMPHISRHIRVYAINKSLSLWCSPNIGRFPLKNNTQIWLPTPIFHSNKHFLALCFLILSFSSQLFVQYYKHGRSKCKKTLFYARCCLLWMAGLAFNFFIHGFYIYHSYDYDLYIRKAEHWIAFDHFPQLCASTGMSFLYMPFIILGDIHNSISMSLPFSILSFCVFGAGGMILSSFISGRLWKSWNAAKYTAFIACLFPFSFWILRKGALHETGFMAKSQFFITPHEHPFSMILGNKALLFAWNGLAHNAEAFFILLGIATIFYVKKSLFRYILMGLFLGFAITLRYSACSILPAIFFLDLFVVEKIDEKHKLSKTFSFYIVFAMSGLLAFTPQLLDNFLTNGNVLLPTVSSALFKSNSHNTSSLMHFSNIPNGIHFYFSGHFKFFLLFFLCLYTLEEKKQTLFAWLYFFGILIFYSSMNFFNTSIIRYMITIYPILYITWGGALIKLSISARWVTITTILINLIYPSPEFYKCSIPLDLPMWIHFAIPCGSILFLLILYFKSKILTKKNTIFLLLFLILMIIGDWRILAFIFFLFPAWVAFHVTEIFSQKTIIDQVKHAT